jgi:membrane protein implicated in regulation of membrane protease activity
MNVFQDRPKVKPIHFDKFDGVCGEQGTVVEIVIPNKEWRVCVNGVYWSAEALSPINLLPKDKFYVMGRENIKLFIRPI